MTGPKRTERRERHGFLIAIGLLLAGAVVFNVDTLTDVTLERIDLVAVLPDASGVRVGTAVWVAGVETGRVLSIAFLPREDTIEVALGVRVEGEAREVIRSDSDVRSRRLRLIGQPIVEIAAGSRGGAPVADGDTLRAHPRTDPAVVLARAADMPARFDSLITAAETIERMVQARRPDLDRLDRSLAAVTDAAARLGRQLDGGSIGLLLRDDRLPDRVRSLQARARELTDAVDAVRVRYTGGDGPHGTALADRLASLRGRAARLGADLDRLQQRLDQGDGMLARLQQDSALQVALWGARAQIDSLMAEAQSIALRLILP